MSESFDKISGIRHLPIFPLPLVMLPGEMVPLHIFEPRYREMLSDIEYERNLFGISFFESTDGFSTLPEVGSVGCAAEVRESQTSEDGRSNIITAGIIRYRALEYIDLGKSYTTANVEFFEDDLDDSPAVDEQADKLFEMFQRVAKAAFDLSGQRGRFPDVPRSEPERMSFLVAAAFNLENELKYQLLEMSSTAERISTLRPIVNAAVTAMEESASVQRSAATNGHSKKKIDI